MIRCLVVSVGTGEKLSACLTLDSFYEAYNIVNYILEKKKYKYLELFDYLHDYRSIDIDKVNSLLEENPKYFKYFYFYPKELLNDSTVESIINYDVSFALSGFDIVWYNSAKFSKEIFISSKSFKVIFSGFSNLTNGINVSFDEK